MRHGAPSVETSARRQDREGALPVGQWRPIAESRSEGSKPQPGARRQSDSMSCSRTDLAEGVSVQLIIQVVSLRAKISMIRRDLRVALSQRMSTFISQSASDGWVDGGAGGVKSGEPVERACRNDGWTWTLSGWRRALSRC
jgi:hypothetical protein